MNLDRIRSAIERAISVSMEGTRLPGIVRSEILKVPISSQQLQRIAEQLGRDRNCQVKLSAQVKLFLRTSNTDVSSSLGSADFLVLVQAVENDLVAVASSEEDWEEAWERGIEPLKQAALKRIRKHIRRMNGIVAEDSYHFPALMVLLASEFVGPYAGRIARFLGYPLGVVEVMAARLYKAKIWERDEVRCERWFKKGSLSLLLDSLVAQGLSIGRLDEQGQCVYHHPGKFRTSQVNDGAPRPSPER